MKILIDMSNSPHVLFFRPIIQELEKRGHNIIITAREHAQTKELLDLYDFKYTIIGKHVGKGIFKKLFNALFRVIELSKYISKENPDLCISHQSPYIIYSAFLNGKKRIYIFDNEHAWLQNKLTFPLANKVICPEPLKMKNEKFINYPGIKESIYLRDVKTKNKGLEKIERIKKKKIFIRTEISDSAYIQGDSLFNLVKELSLLKEFKVIVSPRNQKQTEEYKKIDGIIVLEKPVDGPSIIKMVDLVMSGGGTMNREAAVLGVHVISVYSGDLLEVDRYLIERGLMIHEQIPSIGLIKKNILKKIKEVDFDKIGKEALNKIIDEIEDFDY